MHQDSDRLPVLIVGVEMYGLISRGERGMSERGWCMDNRWGGRVESQLHGRIVLD